MQLQLCPVPEGRDLYVCVYLTIKDVLISLCKCWQVDDLKEKLAAQEVELKQKNEDADALIKRVGVETEKVLLPEKKLYSVQFEG